MNLIRKTKFNDLDVNMSKIILIDANPILLPVMNSISKYALGEHDLFSHYSLKELEHFQYLICKYTTWADTGAQLTLFDLSNNQTDFLCIFFEMIEFNFGFFTQARKIWNRINGIISERKENQEKQKTKD